MNNQRVFRNEKKYEVAYGDYLLLRSLLSHTFSLDPNADKDGDYFVRSVYFDTQLNKDFYDKVIGTQKRKKIRIRTYDLSSDQYKLELKYKVGSLLLKDTVVISKAEYKKIMVGDYDIKPLFTEEGQRIRETLLEDVYKPVVTVDYEREAYVHPFSNIRINFDKNIRSSQLNHSIAHTDINMQPINYDTIYVLEVKYNDFLPDWVCNLLSQVTLTQTSFSKYCYSRLF